MTDRFFYGEIQEEDLPPSVLRSAKKMLNYCKKTLNLPETVHIRWAKVVDRSAYELDAAMLRLQKSFERLAGRYFSQSDTIYKSYPEEFWGLVYGASSTKRDQIWVRADIPLEGILKTIAHECQHIRDGMDFPPEKLFNPCREHDEWERRADRFAEKALREFDF